MTFMTEGGERSVRERIMVLSKKSRTRGSVLAAVFAAVVLICGCAFTGAEREGANLSGELGEQETAGTNGNGQAGKDTAAVSGAQNRQQLNEGDDEEFARIQKEYEEAVKNAKLAEVQVREVEKNALQEADRAAFEEALNYHGVMEGKDDSELSLNRQVVRHTINIPRERRKIPWRTAGICSVKIGMQGYRSTAYIRRNLVSAA